MKIKEISYDQMIQLKQYEPVRISATAIVDENENPEEAADKLKAFVRGELVKVWNKFHKIPEPVPSKNPSPVTATIKEDKKQEKVVAVPQNGTATSETKKSDSTNTDGEVPDF